MSIGLLLLAPVLLQGPVVEVPPFDPRLRPADYPRWFGALTATRIDPPWQSRPWHARLDQGILAACDDVEPLLLWLEEVHPFGCADQRGMVLRRRWEEGRLPRLLSAVVPCADEVAELRTLSGPERAFLDRLAGGDAADLRAGVYLCAPDGTLLSYSGSTDLEELAAALDAGLRKWAERTIAEWRADCRVGFGHSYRFVSLLPLDGMVMEVRFQDAPGPSREAPPALFGPWNRDFVWLSADEVATIAPDRLRLGSRGALPQDLAERIALTILQDAVVGHPRTFTAGDLIWAELESRVVSRKPDAIVLELRGRFHAERGGRWNETHTEWMPIESDDAGAKGFLVGRLTLDPATRQPMLFKLSGLVQHWGSHTLDGRTDEGGPGVAYTAVALAPTPPWLPSVEVPPAVRAPYHEAWQPRHDDYGPLPRWAWAVRDELGFTLDGEPKESAWRQARWSEDFLPTADEGRGSRAAWTWSPRGLGIAVVAPFEGEHPPKGDGYEFLLDAGAPDGEVLQVVIHPDGEFTARLHGDGGEGAAPRGIRHAVHVGADAWTAELEVPWEVLATGLEVEVPPTPPVAWRLEQRRLGAAAAAWSVLGGDPWTDREDWGRLWLRPSLRPRLVFGAGGLFR